MTTESAINSIIAMDDIREALESQVPQTLIVTNLPDTVFTSKEMTDEFETIFRRYDSEATFMYLKTFRRAKVKMTTSEASLIARVQMHKQQLSCGTEIKCYFAQPAIPLIASEPHLKPPKPDRQFLISPPASPPVDWEPILESEPVINYELLSALAALAPGESHEIHPASDDQPGIVVTPCEESDPGVVPNEGAVGDKPKIVQTRCPERKQI